MAQQFNGQPGMHPGQQHHVQAQNMMNAAQGAPQMRPNHHALSHLTPQAQMHQMLRQQSMNQMDPNTFAQLPPQHQQLLIQRQMQQNMMMQQPNAMQFQQMQQRMNPQLMPQQAQQHAQQQQQQQQAQQQAQQQQQQQQAQAQQQQAQQQAQAQAQAQQQQQQQAQQAQQAQQQMQLMNQQAMMPINAPAGIAQQMPTSQPRSQPQPQSLAQPQPQPRKMVNGTGPIEVGPGMNFISLRIFADELVKLCATPQSIDEWQNFVVKHFAQNAIYKQILEDGTQQIKHFEICFPSIARFYLTMFSSGIKSLQMHFEGIKEMTFGDGSQLVNCERCTLLYWFADGTQVTCNGSLRVIYNAENKIEVFEMIIQEHNEYMLRSAFSPPESPNLKSPKKKGKAKDRPPLPPSPVTSWGIPQSMVRFLEISELVSQMRPLFSFQMQNPSLTPREALSNYLSRNSPHRSPHASPAQAPGLAAQLSQQGSSGSGSANTSPNVNKKRRASIKEEEDVNGTKKKPSPKVPKRQKTNQGV